MNAEESKVKYQILDQTVYPSEDRTVSVEVTDTYNGAHKYTFVNSLGFSDGKAKYDGSSQTIQFVQKDTDGNMIPGIQSEQLVIALLDRVHKLNAVFPCEENSLQAKALQDFLDACKLRVTNRISRGVMGDLKK